MKLKYCSYKGPSELGIYRVLASLNDAVLLTCAMRNELYPGTMEVIREQTDNLPKVFSTCFRKKEINLGVEERIKSSIEKVKKLHPEKNIFITTTQTTELLKPRIENFTDSVRVININPYLSDENKSAGETLMNIYRSYSQVERESGDVNIIGPAKLGFRDKDTLENIKSLLKDLGIDINLVYPLNAGTEDIKFLKNAKANICLPAEISLTLAKALKNDFGQEELIFPPVGLEQTKEYVEKLLKINGGSFSELSSIEEEYNKILNGLKGEQEKVMIVGDATHTIPLGNALYDFGFNALIACYEDYEKFIEKKQIKPDIYKIEGGGDVEKIAKGLNPQIILGTQNEMKLANKLNVKFEMISSPGQTRKSAFNNNSFFAKRGFKRLKELCKSIKEK